MSRRYSLSNAALDAAVKGTSWTREVPFKFLSENLPDLTPARESDRGRGAPIFDLYGVLGGTEIGVSYKVSREARNPRNMVLTTGKPDHVAGVYSAVYRGTMVPLWAYNLDPQTGAWSEVRLMACQILRDHPVLLSSTFNKHPEIRDEIIEALQDLGVQVGIREGRESAPVSVSLARRKSGRNPDGSQAYKLYASLRINLAPLGAKWADSEGPTIPKSWEDFGGDLVG